MSNKRRSEARTAVSVLAAMLGIAVALAVPDTWADASMPSPTFSATGVCVNGVPQLAFTLTGLPPGQQTVVFLSLFDSPEAVGTGQVTAGPGVSTFLWNTSNSPLFGSGSHSVAVEVDNVWIPATNLTARNVGFANPYYVVTLPMCGTLPLRFVALAPTSHGQGYWDATADGQVLGFGDAAYFGSMSGVRLNRPIVAIAPTTDAMGYWMVGGDGGVFTFGDAQFLGSTGAMRLNAPVVGMAATPDGKGYWLVASDGGVFAYGDAQFLGSAANLHLDAPVVAITTTSVGAYRLVAGDGGVFDFGASAFEGSLAGITLSKPVVGSAATTDGQGYWMIGADGGAFALGDAGFFGSIVGAPTAI